MKLSEYGLRFTTLIIDCITYMALCSTSRYVYQHTIVIVSMHSTFRVPSQRPNDRKRGLWRCFKFLSPAGGLPLMMHRSPNENATRELGLLPGPALGLKELANTEGCWVAVVRRSIHRCVRADLLSTRWSKLKRKGLRTQVITIHICIRHTDLWRGGAAECLESSPFGKRNKSHDHSWIIGSQKVLKFCTYFEETVEPDFAELGSLLDSTCMISCVPTNKR